MAQKYIIITDDDNEDREIFIEAVSEQLLGARAGECENCISLLEKLEAETVLPDIIFLDLNMPGMNGKECLAKIRGSDKFRHIPIIIYSTSSALKHIDETYNLGASLYVTKPNEYGALKQMLTTVVNINWLILQPIERNKFEYKSTHFYNGG